MGLYSLQKVSNESLLYTKFLENSFVRTSIVNIVK